MKKHTVASEDNVGVDYKLVTDMGGVAWGTQQITETGALHSTSGAEGRRAPRNLRARTHGASKARKAVNPNYWEVALGQRTQSRGERGPWASGELVAIEFKLDVDMGGRGGNTPSYRKAHVENCQTTTCGWDWKAQPKTRMADNCSRRVHSAAAARMVSSHLRY